MLLPDENGKPSVPRQRNSYFSLSILPRDAPTQPWIPGSSGGNAGTLWLVPTVHITHLTPPGKWQLRPATDQLHSPVQNENTSSLLRS